MEIFKRWLIINFKVNKYYLIINTTNNLQRQGTDNKFCTYLAILRLFVNETSLVSSFCIGQNHVWRVNR